jgi:23S rRNA U2552 (ribose-2'-O)-methylase RlmE/FtsJ
MTYYLLPKTNIYSYKFIDCITDEELPTSVISNSLSNYLYKIKKEIDKREKDWDTYKKYTNPYEYIHTQVPSKKKCVSKYKPLSRSYFKMIEILSIFDLDNFTKRSRNKRNYLTCPESFASGLRPSTNFGLHTDIPRFSFSKQKSTEVTGPIRSFHLAEGPGGFIEALVNTRKCYYDQYIGMTILDDHDDPNIPAWKKTEYFLRQNKNVVIETGADGTGNILSVENFCYCKEKYGGSMDIVTADGGFDFSLDFNNQEIVISQLLFSQICYALVMQRRGGNFVLKIFDTFMQHSVDLLYILSSFYDKVYLIKPQTSRYANSEKYVVCKGFLFSSVDAFYPYLLNAFKKMLIGDMYIHRFIHLNIPINFLSRLEEYNAIFGQQQIENIYYTLSLTKNKNKQEKIENLIKTNIQKCISWCLKYNIPYHTFQGITDAIDSGAAEPPQFEESNHQKFSTF